MKNDYKQMLIDKYFEQNLSKKEQRQFDKLMQEDEGFKGDVDFERSVREAIEHDDLLDFRNKISHTIKKQNRKAIFRQITGTYWKYAASVVLVLGVGVSVLFFVNNRNSNDYLFKSAYTETKQDIQRSRISSASSVTVAEAMLNYHEGNYYNAIGYFKELLKKDQKNIAVRFYLGISYMETDNFEKASGSFRYIISDQNNLYIEHAEWYLGLCFLKQDEIDKAINQFTIIAQNDQNYYSSQAEKMLDKINRDF